MGHRRKHHRAYGVIFDESTSTPTCKRIGQGQSSAAATKMPDNLMVLQSLMRGCLLNDAGEVQYYTGATDRTKKEDMLTPSVLTGADGQVAVEIAQGWLKYWYEGTEHHWLISKEQFNGAARLPAFFKNNEWVKNRYMSAYEGVLYDDSESRYTNGVRLEVSSTVFDSAGKTITQAGRSHPFTLLESGDKLLVAGTTNNNKVVTIATGGTGDQVITVDEVLVDETAANTTIETQKDWNNDVLSSVSGKSPINYGYRSNFRTAGASRGTGWRQQGFDLVSAIQLLYLVEYASFNSQLMIGNGLTNFGGANWANRNNYNPIELTGLSNSLGNASGGVDNGANALGSFMSYRSIENFFGHIWKWVDGFNINGGIPYVSNVDTDFADNTATGVGGTYARLLDVGGAGITLPQGLNAYQQTLEQISRGFLPASLGGGSTTYITDFYYQNIGWRVAVLGGAAYSGAFAGVAYWYLNFSSGYRDRDFGGRLCR